jgi:regulator of protease activity HflC (stomatin/prohibitin superfamily)
MDQIFGGIIPCICVAVLVVAFAAATTSVRIAQEYERGVIFRLGRSIGIKGPGLFFLIPFVDRMVKVDLRVITLDIPTQEAITHDNVTVRVNAVAYFRVIDPMKAVVQIEDFRRATWQIAQTSLRSTIGEASMDELLSQRENLNEKLAQIIDVQTEPWGVKVSIVEVKDVELPDTMQRAMALQATAEREKRAKIIHAEGEFQAAEQLKEAAVTMSAQPMAMQLRYLQTLTEIAAEKNSTIIFPVPIDIFAAFVDMANAVAKKKE